MDEHDLIGRARLGDKAALDALWQRYRRWVAAVLLAHKPRETDLDDLLQEVALTVVEKLGQLDDPKAFKPWLRTIAVNAARATGRKQTRRRGLLKLVRHEVASVGSDGQGRWNHASGIERAERSRRMTGLIDRLPEIYRECVLLRCVRGMTHAQISAITGLPETTVETRIARGRRALRELANEANTPQEKAATP
ncbi:MAG: sigma-70 family RNA polymerase sigma factor [Planctomycetota bacterium]